MEKFAPIAHMVGGHPYSSLACFILGCATLVRLAQPRSRSHLPPGPRGYPILGNLLDLPPNHIWEKFGAWGGLYGDVTYVSVLGQEMIILNSSKAAVELLDKRSANYSDRPIAMMCGEIVGWNRSLALLRYGPRFREFRKYMNKVIGTRASMGKFAPLMEKEMAKLVARIASDPGSLVRQIRRTAATFILMISYGYPVKEHDDPLVHVAEAAVSAFSECLEPGTYFVDMIPLLQYVPEWFPGAGWKTKGKKYKELLDFLTESPYQFVKDQMAAGTAVPSFTSELLDKKEITPEVEYNIKWAASSLYAGGAHTTVSVIHSFFLAMTLHPEAQRKAQAEIDRVIGNDRFPTLDDQPSLPYLDALMKEVFRWNPVAPLGVPHIPAEDDIYEGHFIPKGISVIANIWQILHDPDSYKKPLEFNPERFLGEEPEPDPRETAFGHGRRICPGFHLAQSTLWLASAVSLAALNIGKPVDEFGNVVEIEARYTNGAISNPYPFECAISPRSEKSAALIASVEL